MENDDNQEIETVEVKLGKEVGILLLLAMIIIIFVIIGLMYHLFTPC